MGDAVAHISSPAFGERFLGVTPQFRVSMLGNTQFEVVDLIALCEVCPNSSEVEAYSKSHLQNAISFLVYFKSASRIDIADSHIPQNVNILYHPVPYILN